MCLVIVINGVGVVVSMEVSHQEKGGKNMGELYPSLHYEELLNLFLKLNF